MRTLAGCSVSGDLRQPHQLSDQKGDSRPQQGRAKRQAENHAPPLKPHISGQTTHTYSPKERQKRIKDAN